MFLCNKVSIAPTIQVFVTSLFVKIKALLKLPPFLTLQLRPWGQSLPLGAKLRMGLWLAPLKTMPSGAQQLNPWLPQVRAEGASGPGRVRAAALQLGGLPQVHARPLADPHLRLLHESLRRASLQVAPLNHPFLSFASTIFHHFRSIIFHQFRPHFSIFFVHYFPSISTPDYVVCNTLSEIKKQTTA
jgi:hypothetical protein